MFQKLGKSWKSTFSSQVIKCCMDLFFLSPEIDTGADEKQDIYFY